MKPSIKSPGGRTLFQRNITKLRTGRAARLAVTVVWAAGGIVGGCEKAGPPTAAADKGSSTIPDEHGPGDHDAEAGEHHEHGHEDEVKLTAAAIQAHHVQVAAAEKKVLVSTLTAPARLGFDTERVAHVGSILKGRIAELKFRLGDTVKKGQPLLVVDSAELGEAQSEFLQRQVAADIAKPALELAKGAYERAQSLYDKSQGISLSDLQKRLGEFQAAQGTVGAATAAVTASGNRLQLLGMSRKDIESLGQTRQLNPKFVIAAPIDGQIVERDATLGELVSPEKEHLLTIADMRSLWVFADVPEARLADIAEGAKARVSVAASQGEAVEGVVSHILPQLDASTRTARLRIEIKNDQLTLRPGMFATVQVTTSVTEGVVAVPDAAVQTVEGEPAVFVPHVSEENTFVKRPVEVGASVDGMVPILGGLKAGERYVFTGSFILKAEIGKAGASHEH